MRIAALGFAVLGLASFAASAADAPPAELGQRIYSTICQGCHMSEGQGAKGAGEYPKLAGNPRMASWQFVALTVLMGRHGMPAFGGVGDVEPAVAKMAGQLTDEQIAAVVNYVRTHFGNDFKDKATTRDVGRLPHPGGNGIGRAG